ncbi:hypothetical protein JCM8097_008368 [Rhodosporidiobolus ruineniae]
MTTPRKNIVIVGGSYVGQGLASELLKVLDSTTHRVVIIDRNSHFGHLFAYPRFSIVPSHEHKAFIPFHPMLPAPHAIVQAEAEAVVEGNRVRLDREVQLPGEEGRTREIEYEELILATGTKLSKPGTLELEKADSVKYLQSIQSKLKDAKDIVVIGGGAVGVQMATDLAVLYADQQKSITVVQSRRLMPRFHPRLHEIVLKRFEELGIKSVLNVRAEIPEGGYEGLNERGGGEVVLKDGRRIKADYVIHALGQTPNSQLLAPLASSAILPTGFVRVAPSLLVSPTSPAEAQKLDGRVWAIGDIAETGAAKAARPAILEQAPILVRNLEKVMKGEGDFESYAPSPGAIHLTLGIVESVVFRNPPFTVDAQTGEKVYEEGVEPVVMERVDGVEDMNIESVWERRVPGFIGGDVQRYHL